MSEMVHEGLFTSGKKPTSQIGGLFRSLFKTRKKVFGLEEFPFGIRISAILDLDLVNYEYPGRRTPVSSCIQRRNVVVSIGEIMRLDSYKDYVAYLGRQGIEKGKELNLLYFLTTSSKKYSILYFAPAYKISKGSENWNSWTQMGSGIIGSKKFDSPDGLSYERLWGDDDWLGPLEKTETRYNFPYGMNITKTDLSQMLFARRVSDLVIAPIEYLLLVQSKFYIQVFSGFEIPKEGFSVISDYSYPEILRNKYIFNMLKKL